MAEVKRQISVEERHEEESRRGIKFGSPQHVEMLALGYGFASIAEAEDLLKDPTASFDERRRARSFIANCKAKPRPISRRSGWKRVKA